MKARRTGHQRSNSIDADIHDLEHLRRHLRGQRLAMDGIILSEQSDRAHVVESRSHELQLLYSEHLAKEKYAQLKARITETTLPAALVARLADLITKSRSLAHEEQQRRRDEHRGMLKASVMDMKASVQKAKDANRVTHDAWLAQQRAEVAAQRDRAKAKREGVRRDQWLLNCDRADDVRGHLETGLRHACEQDVATRAALRQRIDEQRLASPSPLLFLQLPPMRVTRAHTPVVATRCSREPLSGSSPTLTRSLHRSRGAVDAAGGGVAIPDVLSTVSPLKRRAPATAGQVDDSNVAVREEEEFAVME